MWIEHLGTMYNLHKYVTIKALGDTQIELQKCNGQFEYLIFEDKEHRDGAWARLGGHLVRASSPKN